MKTNLDTVYNQIAADLVEESKHILQRDEFKVFLYGSYARGDNHEESDIDFAILVYLPNEEFITKDKLFSKLESRLSLKYNATISIFLKNKDIFEKWLPVLPFYQNIDREGVQLYAGK